MKTVYFKDMKELMDVLPDNRDETEEGSLCIALFFPDPNYYLFEAEKVSDDDYHEENGRFVVDCGEAGVGHINYAYYWRVLK